MPDTGKVHNSLVGKNVRDDMGEPILEEIRENYECDFDAFEDIRSEGTTDITYIANDPWPTKEKEARRQLGRPMCSIDQLNQYADLVINEFRQNPREIKVSPSGYGATAKLAELRENRIRAIQYRSNAQDAYICMLENACQRSYGYLRVNLEYENERSFEQTIKICRVPNPDSILFDQNCKEVDGSDADHCFVTDNFTIREFKRRWPKAIITDFSTFFKDFPQWIKDKYVQVAEYWKVEEEEDTLVQFVGPDENLLTEQLSRLPQAKIAGDQLLFLNRKFRIIQERPTKRKKVMQYWTNGVEVLEEHDWVGKWIPIIPCYGKELYIDDSGTSKRILQSLIRNARDAQMGYNYFKTCQMEAAGMVPKTTYLAVEGQFEGHEEEVEEANKIPKAFTYYKQRVDGMAAGDPPLPAPVREPFDPPIQNLEMGAESFARGIQSAIGMYNSSVGKNDTNVKSGKAIEELDAQSDLGSLHFLLNGNRAIAACGRVVNDLISKIEVNQREVPIMTNDKKESMVKINQPFDTGNGQMEHHDMTLGEYDVTISVAPNEDSQREEASDFLDTFVKELPALIPDPAKREALTALAIQIKQMGPIADKMVEILSPEAGNPQDLQQQLQQATAQLQALQQENAALHQDRAGRVIEQQTKIFLEKMKSENAQTIAAFTKKMDYITRVVVAQLGAKSKADDRAAQVDAERELQMLGFNAEHAQASQDAAHEVGIQAVDHAHEHSIADKQAQIAQAQLQATQAHEAGMKGFDHAHEVGMQMGDQGFEANQNAAERMHESSEGVAERESAGEQAEAARQHESSENAANRKAAAVQAKNKPKK